MRNECDRLSLGKLEINAKLCMEYVARRHCPCSPLPRPRYNVERVCMCVRARSRTLASTLARARIRHPSFCRSFSFRNNRWQLVFDRFSLAPWNFVAERKCSQIEIDSKQAISPHTPRAVHSPDWRTIYLDCRFVSLARRHSLSFFKFF